MAFPTVRAESIDFAVLRTNARAFERDRNVALHQLENQRGEIADRDLATRAEVDRLANRLWCFGGFDESFDCVRDEVEIACRLEIAETNLGAVECLCDYRRNDCAR